MLGIVFVLGRTSRMHGLLRVVKNLTDYNFLVKRSKITKKFTSTKNWSDLTEGSYACQSTLNSVVSLPGYEQEVRAAYPGRVRIRNSWT